MNGPMHYIERKTSHIDEPFMSAPEVATTPQDALRAGALGVATAGVGGWFSFMLLHAVSPNVAAAYNEADLAWKLIDTTAAAAVAGTGTLSLWAAAEGVDMAWRGIKRSRELRNQEGA